MDGYVTVVHTKSLWGGLQTTSGKMPLPSLSITGVHQAGPDETGCELAAPSTPPPGRLRLGVSDVVVPHDVTMPV